MAVPYLSFIVIILLSIFGLSTSAQAASNSELLKVEIEAGKLAVAGNFQGAVNLYSQILAVDSSNTDVYLQRSLMYRELGDTTMSQRDAAVALDLLNRKFAEGHKRASLYRERANALRLLKRFPEAKTDMETAIRMSKSNKWVPDLQAIYLEEKMYSAK